jgi:pyridinium-3,5-biscarboxylic acid mononucleotide sulfurtransferase
MQPRIYEKDSIRIEVSPSQIRLFTDDGLRLKVLAKMKELGYHYVSLDLEGYRQGSLNETLGGKVPDAAKLRIATL